jgi:hypothetical protein
VLNIKRKKLLALPMQKSKNYPIIFTRIETQHDKVKIFAKDINKDNYKELQTLIKTIADEKEQAKQENEKAYNMLCHINNERAKYNEIKNYIVQ